jgi:hypothetical protein
VSFDESVAPRFEVASPAAGHTIRANMTADEEAARGRRCRVISLQDLIHAKEALRRDKDLLAAKELRAIAGQQK